jgi:WD40 repeat protein
LQSDLIDSPGSNVFVSEKPQLKATLSSCNGGHGSAVTSLASLGNTSPLFVSVSFDEKVKIWDASTGTLVRNTQQVHSNWITSAVALSNNMFVSGDREGKALVWNATTG